MMNEREHLIDSLRILADQLLERIDGGEECRGNDVWLSRAAETAQSAASMIAHLEHKWKALDQTCWKLHALLTPEQQQQLLREDA